jgi:glycosyltransferase involved in cell wall biosynthesis
MHPGNIAHPAPDAPATRGKFVVATPGRSVCDDNARALEKHGLLRFMALGTRRGIAGVPPERTKLNPLVGLAAYAGVKTFSSFRAESFRFRLSPWFDRWVLKQLTPGDHVISSYGYTNASFAFARRHGGRTFLDGGNSHPDNFWEILEEEHRRWNSPHPPIARHAYERSRAMLPEVDYVLSPSAYVTRSFLTRGFKPAQILQNIYPVNLSHFQPGAGPRPKQRPLTLINTGGLSLRKGSPYLLDAFRLIRRQHPDARLVLTRVVRDDMRAVLPRYSDLPIDWSPSLGHPALAELLRGADIFILPSLEDGFARTVTEALSCGLPVITTPNTGASDFVKPDVSGEIVPIRDPQAIADAVLKWAERILAPGWQPHDLIDTTSLSVEYFERTFLAQLGQLGLA